ncbi:MAG: DUF2256 domain-containing protein [Actinomycetota bacterium]|nr:DUF2256 domain-containing protein [Actinomycetota bacterium]
MTHAKLNLPTKTCPSCGFDFAYRKKWRNNWDSVVYCSERCRRSKGGSSRGTQLGGVN